MNKRKNIFILIMMAGFFALIAPVMTYGQPMTAQVKGKGKAELNNQAQELQRQREVLVQQALELQRQALQVQQQSLDVAAREKALQELTAQQKKNNDELAANLAALEKNLNDRKAQADQKDLADLARDQALLVSFRIANNELKENQRKFAEEMDKLKAEREKLDAERAAFEKERDEFRAGQKEAEETKRQAEKLVFINETDLTAKLNIDAVGAKGRDRVLVSPAFIQGQQSFAYDVPHENLFFGREGSEYWISIESKTDRMLKSSDKLHFDWKGRMKYTQEFNVGTKTTFILLVEYKENEIIMTLKRK